MNNMLIGVIASAVSSYAPENRRGATVSPLDQLPNMPGAPYPRVTLRYRPEALHYANHHREPAESQTSFGTDGSVCWSHFGGDESWEVHGVSCSNWRRQHICKCLFQSTSWWHRLMMCQADVAHENGKLGRGKIHWSSISNRRQLISIPL